MYAIVEINGQQFKVEEGKKLFVHHIKDAEAGKTVEFEKVTVEVVNPLVKGDKVIVFKMKRRKDYRVKNGHRAQFTEVTVKSINA